MLRTLSGRFYGLRNAPPELWIVYLIKFLESYAYFSMSVALVLYLSKEFGMNDQQAGNVYGWFGLLVGVFALLAGFIVDIIGVRASLILGSVLLLISRGVLSFTTDVNTALAMLYLLLPLGMSLGIPVMTTGIRRYTNESNRSFGFSLFYVVMNIAALVALPAVDVVRTAYKHGAYIMLPGLGEIAMSEYRVLFATGAAATFAMLLLSLFAVREIDVAESGEARAFTPKAANPWTMVSEIVTESRFWRFILFLLLLTGVRFIFRHLDATFPKYFVREMGEDAPFGTIAAVNPLIIIFLTPVVTAFTMHISAFQMIFWGAILSSISVFFLIAGASYATALAFVVLLSIGEAIWSPRLYEYSAMIAPKGREGTYQALGAVPMFIPKYVVGWLSGWLLTNYCPETGPRQSELMWLYIGLMTLSSPILMWLLAGVIQGGNASEPTKDEDEIEEQALEQAAGEPDTK